MAKTNSNKKKSAQLGMAHGTANSRLRKDILFKLVQDTEKDYCFQCGKRIKNIDDFSIEHKTPWLDSKDPVGLFFDLDNIAFSHIKCNYRASRNGQKPLDCPSVASYKRGCRCSGCFEAMRKYHREDKRKKRNTPRDRFKI